MISEIITRLSKLDAPDREVDGEIWRYLMSGEPRGVLHGPIPELTASIDAAIALAERVLLGWTFEHIGQDYIRARGLDNDVMPVGWTVEISDGAQTIQGQAPTLPLAICIAILRAKEASKP
ncbi:hypothetical protein [Ochrobactrum sp. A-1]|uniref:hypothetical protein n=1 Tax=Ochrobactrum sp. A-1 TaxID=2920940 RepID=UPI001F0A26EC|nr:hypothetical protein [Ochrobactrum sp. A-1]